MNSLGIFGINSPSDAAMRAPKTKPPLPEAAGAKETSLLRPAAVHVGPEDRYL
jgi:hypothetical protein